MLSKLIDTYRKRGARKRSIAKVRASKQAQYGVVNVYRNDQSNVGDYHCAPHHFSLSCMLSQWMPMTTKASTGINQIIGLRRFPIML